MIKLFTIVLVALLPHYTLAKDFYLEKVASLLEKSADFKDDYKMTAVFDDYLDFSQDGRLAIFSSPVYVRDHESTTSTSYLHFIEGNQSLPLRTQDGNQLVEFQSREGRYFWLNLDLYKFEPEPSPRQPATFSFDPGCTTASRDKSCWDRIYSPDRLNQFNNYWDWQNPKDSAVVQILPQERKVLSGEALESGGDAFAPDSSKFYFKGSRSGNLFELDLRDPKARPRFIANLSKTQTEQLQWLNPNTLVYASREYAGGFRNRLQIYYVSIDSGKVKKVFETKPTHAVLWMRTSLDQGRILLGFTDFSKEGPLTVDYSIMDAASATVSKTVATHKRQAFKRCLFQFDSNFRFFIQSSCTVEEDKDRNRRTLHTQFYVTTDKGEKRELNIPLTRGGYIGDMRLSPRGDYLYIFGDVQTDNKFELYRIPTNEL